jgi:hypothetical protein
MHVVFMVDGEIKHEAKMDAVPRIGEKIWFRSTRGKLTDYAPGKVTAVDWYGSDRVELRISTGR